MKYVDPGTNADSRGVDITWADGVNPDTQRSELTGHGPSHLEDSGFRAVVSYPVLVLQRCVKFGIKANEGHYALDW